MTTDKYCDCAQGRWPCTCMPRGRETVESMKADIDAVLKTCRELDQARARMFMEEMNKCHGRAPVVGTEFLSELDRVEKTRPGYWERLATDKAKLFALKCGEVDVLNARLRVYRGVALIGWTGFILVLLGV